MRNNTNIYNIKLLNKIKSIDGFLNVHNFFEDHLKKKDTYVQFLNISIPLICFVFCTR